MTPKFYLTAALALTLLAGAALAIEPSIPRQAHVFARLDADKNGKVTLEEMRPAAEKRLLRYDLDKNGAVSAKEIQAVVDAYMAKRRDRIMAHLDSDKDGAITAAELDKVVEAMFNGADANDDGGITLQEARDFRVAKWRKANAQAAAN